MQQQQKQAMILPARRRLVEVFWQNMRKHVQYSVVVIRER
jgi:hypothetical protein